MLSFFERLDKFMKHRGLNDNKITVETGISNGLIGKGRKRGTLSQDNISKILYTYPELNANWLFLGEGEMFKDQKEYKETKADPLLVGESDMSYSEIENIKSADLESASKDDLITIIKNLLVINDRDSKSLEKMVDTADRNSITLSRLVDVLYGEGIKGGSREMEASAG